MEKVIVFPGQDDKGNIFVEALRFGPGIEKTASIKTSDLHPKLAEYIDGLKPKGGKMYVLVNALGAGEYWGSNINGDWFSEKVLKSEDPKNGYLSFYNAGIYRHHVNKDIGKSMGKVVCSVYNPCMHRVELLLEIDRDKAAKEGHSDLVDTLDSGGHPAVSMGMRTPYDVCSICGHKSKTTNDYCNHLRLEKNKIYSDGRKVYMINPIFKAFDISFVLIGADQTSFAIAKVASAYGIPPEMMGSSAAIAENIYGLEKAASAPAIIIRKTAARKIAAKKTAAQKLAEIVKRVPIMSTMQAGERSIPNKLLDIMGKRPYASALSSSLPLGMILKPREFQRITLIHIDKRPLANEMDRGNMLFRPYSGMRPSSQMSFGSRDVASDIMRALMPMMGQRSMFGPMLHKRIVLSAKPLHKTASPEYISTPLLDKVAEGYDAYRNFTIEKIAEFIKKVTLQDPDILDRIYPDALEESFSGVGLDKTAGAPEKILLFGVMPAMYLLSRAFDKAEGSKKMESGLKSFIYKHPVITGSVLAGLLRTAGR